MPTLRFVERVCPVCGTSDRSSLWAQARFDPARLDSMSFSSRKSPEHMHYRLLECARCDVLYASPVPTADDLMIAYRVADYVSAREAQLAAETYARVLTDIIPALPDRRGAIDIGAGEGAFVEQLLAAGFADVVGFEISTKAIAAANENVTRLIRAEPFDSTSLPPGPYSLVSCLQTIEHVPDPLDLCSSAATALQPGGALLIVCHNRRAISARLLKRRSPIFDVEHLQLFSPTGIRRLLSRAGFERVEVRNLINRYPLGYWLRLAPGTDRMKRAIRTALVRTALDDVLLSLPAGNLVAIGYTPG